MAGMQATGSWVISPQDRAQHERTFYSLGPINGKLNGEKARNYLVQSGLPTSELGHIWTLCDVDRDGQLTSAEFSMAVFVIFCRKSGAQLPRTLPPSLVQSASVNASPAQTGLASQMSPASSQGGAGAQAPHSHGFSGQLMNTVSVQPLASHVYGSPATSLTANSLLQAGSLASLGPQVAGMALSTSNSSGWQGQKSFPASTSSVATNTAGVVNNTLDRKSSLMQASGGGSSATIPDSSVGGEWAIPSSSRFEYNRMFSTTDRFHRGYLTGMEARPLLLRSQAPPAQLAQIWALVVPEGNAAIKCEEFVVAMHLAMCLAKGRALPKTLPPELARLKTASTPLLAHGNASSGTGAAKSTFAETSTLEDRKRDNFSKGQEVLERKRLELQEQARKEREEKERKRQEEEEKRARERREQEMKQQAELERQRRKMMEEQQKRDLEEQKLVMQRQAAQQELERKRREDQIRERKLELMQQRSRLVDQVNSVKPQARRVSMELATLEHQRTELNDNFKSAKEQYEEIGQCILNLTTGRSSSGHRLEEIRAETTRARQHLSQVTSERERLGAQVAEVRGSESVQGYQSAMNDLREVTGRVQALRLERSNVQRQILQRNAEVENERRLIQNLRQEEKQKTSSAEQAKARLQLMQTQLAEEKRQQQLTNQRKLELEAKMREEEERQKQAEIARKKQEEEQRKQEEERRKREDIARKKQEEEQRRQEEERRKQEEIARQRAEEDAAKKVASRTIYKNTDPFTANGGISSTASWPGEPTAASTSSEADGFASAWPDANAGSSAAADFSAPWPSGGTDGGDAVGAAMPSSTDPFADIPTGTFSTGATPEPNSAATDVFAVNWASGSATPSSELEDGKVGSGAAGSFGDEGTAGAFQTGDVPDGRRQWLGKKQTHDPFSSTSSSSSQVSAPVVPTKTRTATKPPIPVPSYKTAPPPASVPRASPAVPRRPAPVAATRQPIDKGVLTPAISLPATASQPVPQPRRLPEPVAGDAKADAAKLEKEEAVRRKVEELQRKKAELQRVKQMRELEAKKSELENKQSELEKKKMETDAGFVGSPSQYKAEFPFQARSNEELTFNEGDIIVAAPDLGPAEPGWLGGELNGHKGWFPQSYVSMLPATSPLALDSGTGQEGGAATQQAEEPLYALPTTVEPMESMETAVALYAWKAKKDTHLTLKKGDTIIIKEKEDMWWCGELDGKSGWFPKSFVKITGSSVPLKNAAEEGNAAGTGRPPFSPDTGSVQSGQEFVALYPYSGQAGDLAFSQGDVIVVKKKDGDWWEGTCNGNSGAFPATYVSPKSDTPGRPTTPKAPLGQSMSLPVTSGSLGKPVIATVVSAFTATSAEELSLSCGQLVAVSRQDGDWWEGSLQARGKKRATGRFPASHVKLLPSATESKHSLLTTAVANQRLPSPSMASISTVGSPVSAASIGSLTKVTVVYDYEAANEDELTIVKGNILTVHEKGGSWWKGELNGKVGLFPSNYIQEMESSIVNPAQG